MISFYTHCFPLERKDSSIVLDNKPNLYSVILPLRLLLDKKTYPADCRKIAAVDSNKHDWDRKNRRYWKKNFLFKNIFLSPIYLDGISS